MTFDDLLQQYGTGPSIPDDVLYGWMEQEKDKLVQLVKSGVPKDGTLADSIYKLANYPSGQEVRRRSEQDLFWLCRYFTWPTNSVGTGKAVTENAIEEATHKIVCDFFVKKDRTKTLAEQDPKFKNRMLLYPRGGLKSTVDIVDVVQWILNFPDIRILVLTSSEDLADGFVGMVRGHFLQRKDGFSWMNLFFPEFCVSESSREAAGFFTCPLWEAKKISRPEPTVLASTILETRTGLHFDLAKADDPVSNINSKTPKMCDKVTLLLHEHRKMLMRYGYWDNIGTRYQEHDAYGTELARLEKGGSVLKKLSPVLEYLEDEKSKTKILVGRAVQITQESEQRLLAERQEITYENAGEEGCCVLLPKLLSYKEFLVEFDKNALDAEGQLNQNPNPPFDSDFTHQMMVDATTKTPTEIPEMGPVSIFWDFAYSKKKERDYSTATVVMWDRTGVGYVIDFIRKRYTPTELAFAVAESILHHLPIKIAVENAGASRFLESSIWDAALRLARQHKVPKVFETAQAIEWVDVDNTIDAKANRIRALHPEFKFGRMKFDASCPLLSELWLDFERWPRRKHDDGADSLAQQLRYRPLGQRLAYDEEVTTFSYRNKLDNWARRDIFEPSVEDFMALPELVPINLPELSVSPQCPAGMPNILGSGWAA